MSKHRIIDLGIVAGLSMVILMGGLYLMSGSSNEVSATNTTAAAIMNEFTEGESNDDAAFMIDAPKEMSVEAADWLEGNFTSIPVSGGEPPFILQVSGLPKNMQAIVSPENNSILLSGLGSMGKFDVSLALIDANNNIIQNNILMNFKPLRYRSVQAFLGEWAAWLADDVKTTYDLNDVSTVTNVLNILISESP